MRVDDVIAYFGTATRAAQKLNLTPGAITNWRARNGGTVPELWARKLHSVTRARLRFNPSDYGLRR
jgi:hypothetical protein